MGGKSHQLVVSVFGVLTGQQGKPRDGVFVDPDQPSGLADAASFGEVLQDRQDFVMRQLGLEERGPPKFGEPGLADPTVEQPVARLTEVVDDEDVVLAPPAIEVARGILAAKACKVVRGHGASGTDP